MRFKMFCVFAFSFSLIFSSAEISNDLVAAMQKVSEGKTANSDCEKKECKKDLEKRVCELEDCYSCLKNPCFERCDCTNSNGLFVETDFLYWLVKDESSFYMGRSPFGLPQKTEVEAPKNDYKPGTRVGLGYNIPHDNWDVYLEWTWIKSTAFFAKTADNYAMVGPILFSDLNIAVNEQPFNNTFTLSPVNFVKAKSGVKYNTWDLELGRYFYPGSYFSLRPFAGLRGAWIKQVNDRFATSPLSTSVFPISEKIHEKFWGIGLRSGINSEWNFCKSFGIYSNLSASLLFCKFEVEKIGFTEIGLDTDENSVVRKSFHEIKPTVQAALGLSWNKCFCDSILLGLKAGYEINYYWDVVNGYDVSLMQEITKALELSGLTVGMKLEF